MDTRAVTKSQVLCRSHKVKWPMAVFLIGFAAFLVGLMTEVLPVAGAGFAGMVLSLLLMKADVADCFGRSLSGQWRKRTAME